MHITHYRLISRILLLLLHPILIYIHPHPPGDFFLKYSPRKVEIGVSSASLFCGQKKWHASHRCGFIANCTYRIAAVRELFPRGAHSRKNTYDLKRRIP